MVRWIEVETAGSAVVCAMGSTSVGLATVSDTGWLSGEVIPPSALKAGVLVELLSEGVVGSNEFLGRLRVDVFRDAREGRLVSDPEVGFDDLLDWLRVTRGMDVGILLFRGIAVEALLFEPRVGSDTFVTGLDFW
jgi:hypothetical protein